MKHIDCKHRHYESKLFPIVKSVNVMWQFLFHICVHITFTVKNQLHPNQRKLRQAVPSLNDLDYNENRPRKEMKVCFPPLIFPSD